MREKGEVAARSYATKTSSSEAKINLTSLLTHISKDRIKWREALYESMTSVEHQRLLKY